MISYIKNNQKGVTLTVLAVAVIIIVMITSILAYNSKDSVKVKALTNMYNDIENLREKVSEYYSKYGAIPKKCQYTNNDVIGNKNDNSGESEGNGDNKPYSEGKLDAVIGANDTGDFFVIDLNSLDNLTLNFGEDFKKFENEESVLLQEDGTYNQESVNQLSDIYIINEDSHNIFYVKGITVDGQIYYTDYSEGDIKEVAIERYDQVANPPELSQGMIPVKWVSTNEDSPTDGNWVVCNTNDVEWYNYINQTTDGGKSKWANVMLLDGLAVTSDGVDINNVQIKDYASNHTNEQLIEYLNGKKVKLYGSMFVWIPRYAYKITSGLGTSSAGRVEIKFLDKTTNKDMEGNAVGTKYPNTTGDAMDDFVVHPVFRDGSTNNYMNGEWDKELSGFWMAKYPACRQGTTEDESGNIINSGDTVINTNDNLSIDYPVFKPLTNTYTMISIGNSYTVSQKVSSKTDFYGLSFEQIDSHMTKNSELGAVMFLAESGYGRAGTAISFNHNDKMTSFKDVEYSTTNNMNGIFDLRGVVYERMASYISNGKDSSDEFKKNTESFIKNYDANVDGYKTLSTKYVTVYPYMESEDSISNNWKKYKELKNENYGFGDYILEISQLTSEMTGIYDSIKKWHDEQLFYPYQASCFFENAGFFGLNTAYWNTFYAKTAVAKEMYFTGFRTVLVNK